MFTATEASPAATPSTPSPSVFISVKLQPTMIAPSTGPSPKPTVFFSIKLPDPVVDDPTVLPTTESPSVANPLPATSSTKPVAVPTTNNATSAPSSRGIPVSSEAKTIFVAIGATLASGVFVLMMLVAVCWLRKYRRSVLANKRGSSCNDSDHHKPAVADHTEETNEDNFVEEQIESANMCKSSGVASSPYDATQPRQQLRYSKRGIDNVSDEETPSKRQPTEERRQTSGKAVARCKQFVEDADRGQTDESKKKEVCNLSQVMAERARHELQQQGKQDEERLRFEMERKYRYEVEQRWRQEEKERVQKQWQQWQASQSEEEQRRMDKQRVADARRQWEEANRVQQEQGQQIQGLAAQPAYRVPQAQHRHAPPHAPHCSPRNLKHSHMPATAQAEDQRVVDEPCRWKEASRVQHEQWQQAQRRAAKPPSNLPQAQHQPWPEARTEHIPSLAATERPPANLNQAQMATQSDTMHLIKHGVLAKWALYQPPMMQTLKPIEVLITSIHTVLPPAIGGAPSTLGVPGHAHFSKWSEISMADITSGGQLNNKKLRRAYLKLQFFLHPDKRPLDFSEEQHYLCKLLWDVASDAFQAYENIAFIFKDS